MKTILKNTIAFTLISFIVNAQEGGSPPKENAVTEQSSTPTLSITAESCFTNCYLWRGIEYNHGLILQPSLNFDYNGFSLNIWNNSPVSENNGNSITPEIDFTLSKSIEAGNLFFEPAILFYTYPALHSFSATGEISAFVGYYPSSFGIFINPSLDFIANSGGYFNEAGITLDKESDEWHLCLNAAYGYGNKKFSEYNITSENEIATETLYTLVDINGFFKTRINETIYLKPAFNYFRILNSNYQTILKPNQLSISCSVGAEF